MMHGGRREHRPAAEHREHRDEHPGGRHERGRPRTTASGSSDTGNPDRANGSARSAIMCCRT
ncbi:MAG: hypothetical protein ACR2MP_15990 [Streptosporangiaceae bacterium]